MREWVARVPLKERWKGESLVDGDVLRAVAARLVHVAFSCLRTALQWDNAPAGWLEPAACSFFFSVSSDGSDPYAHPHAMKKVRRGS